MSDKSNIKSNSDYFFSSQKLFKNISVQTIKDINFYFILANPPNIIGYLLL